MTPNELLLKYFTEKELKIIKSDPIYFHLNKGVFKNVNILKNKTLIETLDEEEKKIENKKKFMTKTNDLFNLNINDIFFVQFIIFFLFFIKRYIYLFVFNIYKYI